MQDAYTDMWCPVRLAFLNGLMGARAGVMNTTRCIKVGCEVDPDRSQGC